MDPVTLMLILGGGLLFAASRKPKKKMKPRPEEEVPEEDVRKIPPMPTTPYPDPGHVGMVTVGPVGDSVGVVEVSEGISRAVTGAGKPVADSVFVITHDLPVRVMVSTTGGLRLGPVYLDEGAKVLDKTDYDALLQFSFYTPRKEGVFTKEGEHTRVIAIRDTGEGAWTEAPIRIFVERP